MAPKQFFCCFLIFWYMKYFESVKTTPRNFFIHHSLKPSHWHCQKIHGCVLLKSWSDLGGKGTTTIWNELFTIASHVLVLKDKLHFISFYGMKSHKYESNIREASKIIKKNKEGTTTFIAWISLFPGSSSMWQALNNGTLL